MPGRENASLARSDPKLWDQIRTAPTGQTRHQGGLFTWQRITARDWVPGEAPRIVAEDDFLVIASEVSAAEWDQLFAGLRAIFIAGCIGTFGLAAISFGIYRARRSAVDALSASERNLDVTLWSIGDGVLATDGEARVTRMNRVAEQLTGWTLAEARGRPVEQVFRVLHEKTRLPAAIPVASVIARGKSEELVNHTVLVAQDGREHGIAHSASPSAIRRDVFWGPCSSFAMSPSLVKTPAESKPPTASCTTSESHLTNIRLSPSPTRGVASPSSTTVSVPFPDTRAKN